MPEDAPASARNAWNAQLLNLNNVQRTKEGQPLVEDVLLGCEYAPPICTTSGTDHAGLFQGRRTSPNPIELTGSPRQ